MMLTCQILILVKKAMKGNILWNLLISCVQFYDSTFKKFISLSYNLHQNNSKKQTKRYIEEMAKCQKDA